MEKNKNTVLLTVIAIATLLVAVVGATFAYFTAQGDTYKERGAVVQTETTSRTDFTISKAISIDADEYNFAQGGQNLSDSATAIAMYESSTTSNTNRIDEKCYTLKLNVTSNNFVYTHESAGDPDVPEITLTVTKATSSNNSRTQATSNYTYGAATTLINAMDITTLTAGNYYIPATAASTLSDLTTTPTTSCDGNTLTNVHKIVNSNKALKSADKFEVTVTLVNKEYDQQAIAEKSFNATLRFDALDSCKGYNTTCQ